MFDTIHIHFVASQPATRPARPGIRMTDSEFLRGYQSGVSEAIAGELAGIPFTDTEIVDELKALFEAPDTSEPVLYFGIGSLMGMLTARW